MKIYDIDLDSLDRIEYIALLNTLFEYYQCLFGFELSIQEVKKC